MPIASKPSAPAYPRWRNASGWGCSPSACRKTPPSCSTTVRSFWRTPSGAFVLIETTSIHLPSILTRVTPMVVARFSAADKRRYRSFARAASAMPTARVVVRASGSARITSLNPHQTDGFRGRTGMRLPSVDQARFPDEVPDDRNGPDADLLRRGIARRTPSTRHPAVLPCGRSPTDSLSRRSCRRYNDRRRIGRMLSKVEVLLPSPRPWRPWLSPVRSPQTLDNPHFAAVGLIPPQEEEAR
jgi:hypothetical protein